ncbi:MAG TPA: tetratricopeptide repeat protein [Pyrinomonadaceae bacterium]|nr:tetratricopeptide repeat protein [Pyrinomonadaceae bacterium]
MRNTVSFLFIFALTFGGLFIPVSEANSGMFAKFSDAFPQNRNTITGFVFDESRRPINGVYVELLNDTYGTVSRTRTSGSGLYSFRGIANGQFKIKVLPLGTDYEGQTRDVSLVSVSARPGSGAVNEQVDFYLKAKKNVNSGPLAAPGVVFAQEVPKAAEKLYEEGIDFLRDKNEKEGFEKLKSALEIFPQYYLALDRLGTEYVVRGYYRPAYVLLTKALEVNPRSFSSTFGLGLTLYRLEQIDSSIETLQRAVNLYNESVNAHLWLGIAFLHNGKLTQAETSLVKANKLSREESADVHWQLARLYNQQKRYADAADELELFLKHSTKAVETEKIKQTIKQLREKAASK